MSNGRLVFLTGATGYIGSRLARRLVERGDRIRCLVRASSDTSALEELGAELVVGELTDAATIVGALDGVDLAIHLAAVYQVGVVNRRVLERTSSGRAPSLSAINARPPRDLRLHPPWLPSPTRGGRHRVRPGLAVPLSLPETKARAHGWPATQRTGLIIVCPAVVYGPGDRSPMGKYVEDLIAGRLPGLLTRDPWFSYVHVDDVVEAMILAADKGGTGRTYILSGEHASLSDFLGRVAAIAGKRLPRLRFPVGLARMTGSALDVVSRITGLRFPISREAVEVGAGHRWLHSNTRAREELGWNPRPLSEGLPEYVRWFVDQRARRRT